MPPVTFLTIKVKDGVSVTLAEGYIPGGSATGFWKDCFIFQVKTLISKSLTALHLIMFCLFVCATPCVILMTGSKVLAPKVKAEHRTSSLGSPKRGGLFIPTQTGKILMTFE